MKKTHILALLVIAVAIGILITMVGDFSTYQPFATAIQQPERNHTVIGELVKEKPIVYNPEVDANSFSFFMKDEKGQEQKVVCKTEKPQDFERTEQIVIKGKMEGDVFVAHSMQLKCPSKYQDQAIQNAKQEASR